MKLVRIGSSSEYVEIRVPASYSSEGWAQAEVEMAVNSFHGTIMPWVEREDFSKFEVELRALYDTLRGTAEFAPLERQISLKLVGKGGGHIQVTGEAVSHMQENHLTFTLEIDQSYLLSSLQQLKALHEGREGEA